MQYTIEQLNEYSIYQLRMVGYKVGVKAPTALKKSKLVDAILSIQEGNLYPYFPTRKAGRPTKNQVAETNLNQKALLSVDTVVSAQNIILNDSKFYDINKKIEVEGYLVKSHENEYFIVSYENPTIIERVAYLPNKLMDKDRLRSGHFVKVDIVKESENKLPSVVAIKEVEGQIYKGFHVPQFEYREVGFDKIRYFNYMGGSVSYGDRIVFSGEKYKTINYVINLIMGVKNYCESIVCLGMNMTPESVAIMKKNEGLTLFYSLFSDNVETQYFTYKLAIDHAKREAELGKRVIFWVANLDNLYDNLNLNENDKITSLKNLYGLARSFKSEGSFTVISTCTNEFFEKNKFFEDFIDMRYKEEENGVFSADNIKLVRKGF